MAAPRVVAAEDAPAAEVDTAQATPAPGPRSPLAALRGKRAALDARLHLDLAVPRWELDGGRVLWVRYRPGDPAVLTAAVEKREKTKGRDKAWMTKANADFLVAACEAVFDLPAGTQPPAGALPELDEYPTFSSPELSEAVGAPDSAVETARKLYATDGDLMVAAAQLLEWSGKAAEKDSTDFLAS